MAAPSNPRSATPDQVKLEQDRLDFEVRQVALQAAMVSQQNNVMNDKATAILADAKLFLEFLTT